ncbi:MAG: sensor histidine kinase, partial [Kineosporiaceae bacterium]
LRTALLNAVSHDLRAPLASATAAVSSLRSRDVDFTEEDRRELLATAEESLDRLRALVENLLDMSRLQAGALALALQPIGVAEVVPASVDAVGPAARDVVIRIPDDVPDVVADPALLERALANLVANALRFSPPGRPPLVTASALGGHVELRVVDTGPGVPREDWERIFLPFQRLGDRDNSSGVGLGLALSRGLVEAMSGTLVPEATPGGGLTMTIRLPAAPAGTPVVPAGRTPEPAR